MRQSTRYGEELAKAIGDRIRTLRQARGFSQTRFAALAHLDRPVLARVESGRHVPSLLTLSDVADAFGLELSVLLVGVDRTARERASAPHVAAE